MKGMVRPYTWVLILMRPIAPLFIMMQRKSGLAQSLILIIRLVGPSRGVTTKQDQQCVYDSSHAHSSIQEHRQKEGAHLLSFLCNCHPKEPNPQNIHLQRTPLFP